MTLLVFVLPYRTIASRVHVETAASFHSSAKTATLWEPSSSANGFRFLLFFFSP